MGGLNHRQKAADGFKLGRCGWLIHKHIKIMRCDNAMRGLRYEDRMLQCIYNIHTITLRYCRGGWWSTSTTPNIATATCLLVKLTIKQREPTVNERQLSLEIHNRQHPYVDVCFQESPAFITLWTSIDSQNPFRTIKKELHSAETDTLMLSFIGGKYGDGNAC